MLGLKKGLLYASKAKRAEPTFEALKPGFELPASVDWRTAGIVSAVKDQGFNLILVIVLIILGQCGSCWSCIPSLTCA
jgi:hypothetical protein